MYRIDDDRAAASLPVPSALGTQGYFQGANPLLAQGATRVRADWLNMVQEELMGLVIYAQVTGSKTVYNQVLTALKRIFSGNLGAATATRALVLEDLGLLLVDASGGSITLTLPAANALGAGHPMRYRLLRVDTSANAVFIVRSGSDTIDGVSAAIGLINRLEIESDGISAWRTGGGRTRVKQLLTLHVATGGSDTTGTGLSVGSAFATIQKAADYALLNVDTAGFGVNIAVEPGSYAGFIARYGLTGGGSINIVGTGTLASDVVIDGGNGSALSAQAGSQVDVSHVKLQGTGGTGGGIFSNVSAVVTLHDVVFGAVGASQAQVNAQGGGVIGITGNYSITAGGALHMAATDGGDITVQTPITVSLSGTPNFSTAFATANGAGRLNVAGISFSGSATGKRHAVSAQGSINTAGGGASYFPGSIGGTVDSATYGLFQ